MSTHLPMARVLLDAHTYPMSSTCTPATPMANLTISQHRRWNAQLLNRDTSKPATSLNPLATAWIQFQVHNWFQHENSASETYNVQLPEGDQWASPDGTMKIYKKTQPDIAWNGTDSIAPAYKNTNTHTHWWDGSQIYGSTELRTTELGGQSKNGKLTVDAQNIATLLPRDSNRIP
ncbi:hypothetical protein G6011_07930 [Alternaria panax]|uniref:Uncharacterized protein n=1 Tax=Alternaria panax TaxID=48097 RepID=A0AAD4F9N8_9PLEO|nr:hypothetical protein G6011_07930 [Alternaria panax]